MAIDDNTLYGLTGAQVKELPGKINAVKGQARELTEADYNWNAIAHDATTEPFDSIAVWLLPPGDYKVSDLPIAWSIGQQPQPVGETGSLSTSTGSFVVTRGLSDAVRGILKYDGFIVSGGGYGGIYDSPKWYRINTETGVPRNVQDTMGSVDPYLLRGVNIAHNLTTDLRRQDLVLGAEQGKVLKDLIDSIAIRGAGAPTTSTVGQVGTLYEDTTNGDLYICTDATNPYVWEEVGAGPTVVQTLGTSTADVMSQNAISSLIFGNISRQDRIHLGNTSAGGDYSVSIGRGALMSGSNTTVVGALASVFNSDATALGAQTYAGADSSVALGFGAKTTKKGEVNIGTSNASSPQNYGYNSSAYRLLTGLYDGQSDHDAATYGQVISYSAINGAGAPTTATEGKYVGQLYYDTTNEAMYFLKAIDTTTTPATYTWEALGGGGSGETTLYSKTAANAHTAISSLDIAGDGTQATPYAPCHFEDNNGEDHWFYVRTNSLLSSGVLEAYVGGYSYDAAESYWGGKKEARLALYSDVPTVVEEPGSSETNVMSQKATTWMIYNGGNATKVQIGANSGATQEWGVAILGTTNQQGTVAIGNAAAATARGAVAIGMGASASTQGVFDIGLSGVGSSAQTNHGYNSSAYRLLTGLYDPQNAHDAATKGYVDGLVGNIASALNVINNGTGA